MEKYNLNQAREDTRKIVEQMPRKKMWTAHSRLAELMEEVGELANAIETEEGYKSMKRRKTGEFDLAK